MGGFGAPASSKAWRTPTLCKGCSGECFEKSEMIKLFIDFASRQMLERTATDIAARGV